MATTDVSICNMALGHLGANQITSLDDAVEQDHIVEAALCRANYESSRDATLEAFDWTFAIKRFQRAPLAEVPEFEYGKAFLLPAEVLRVLTPLKDGTGEKITDWTLEDRKILCDSDTIQLRAIVRVTDPGKFSSQFVQALAARMAMVMALPLTGSADRFKQMQGLYAALVGEAQSNDGMQGVSVSLSAGTIVKARRGL